MEIADLKYVADHTGSRFAPILTHLLFYTRNHCEEAGGECLYAKDVGADPYARCVGGCQYIEHRVQAGNGRYVVDAPTDLPEMCVDGSHLLAAIMACTDGEPSLSVGDAFVTVSAGRVRARMGLSDPEGYPRHQPDPETAHTAPGVAALLVLLQPFVATDASRPWATCVCVHGGFAYATNNVLLVRVPFPATIEHPVNIPGAVVEAVITKGEPSGLGVGPGSLTFYFDDGVWIKTQLIEGDWPVGVVDGLVDGLSGEAWLEVNPSLGLMLNTAAKLADDRHPVVEFDGNGLQLLDGSFRADDMQPVPIDGKANAAMAALAFTVATHVQWHTPRRDVHAFACGDLVGVFGGQR